MRNIRLLYWFNFFTDFRLYAPFAIIYFAQVSGSYVLGMLVFALATVVSAALEIPTGILSDRWGRKRTVTAGAFFSVLSVLAYASAPGAALLLLGGAMEGVARALYSGNNSALLYDTLAEEGEEASYHHHFGRTTSMFQVALSMAALLGGLTGLYSLKLVMWLSVPPQIAALAVTFLFHEPRAAQTKTADTFSHFVASLKHIRQSPRLLWLMSAQSISFGFGEANFQFTAAFFRALWPLWAIGVLRSGAHGLAAIGFWIAGRVIDRFKHLRVMIFASAFSQIANLSGVLLANVVSPLVMTTPSLLYGLSSTAKGHLLQESFTDEQRATLGSIVSFAGSLVFAVAAIAIGGLADQYGPRTAIVAAMLVQALVIPIYVKLFREQ